MKTSFILLPIFLTAWIFPCTAQRLQPEDLEYRGAFRLPEGSNGSDWNYSGYAMTYYPDGDPCGLDDGYPGSIFAIGHDHQQYVSEIGIPVPVMSETKNPSELNTATTLQIFRDITGGVFGDLEIPRAGLEYLPPQGSQTTGKLHFCWGEHFQFEQVPSHGWCELDLSDPQTAGPWYFDNYTNYITNDYLFEIPKVWTNLNTPGQLLATGRFRDGGWGGQGPTLFAYVPWNDGNPPAENVTLTSITPLLLYGIHVPGEIEITNAENMKMNNYTEADEWSGGAWLTAGESSAVVFVGTKGLGNCWYGFSDGTVWPDEVPDPPHDDRGWWTDSIKAEILFYDPSDLAGVAHGTMQTYEPQPYTTLDIDPYLYDPGFDFERDKRYLVGAACFDRAHGFLYVIERRADEEKSLVHVWKVNHQPTGLKSHSKTTTFELHHNYPNPFNPTTTIRFTLPKTSHVLLKLYDMLGREVLTLVDENLQAGEHCVSFNADGLPSGIYIYSVKADHFTKRMRLAILK